MSTDNLPQGQPGQNAAEIEAARLARNAAFIAQQMGNDAPAPAPAPVAPAPAPVAPAPVQQTPQAPLASNASPAYIPPQVDDETARYQRMFEQTFGNDATKVVKSYVELQKKATETNTVLSQLNALGDRDPKYKQVLDAMMQQKPIEDIRNLLGGVTEPQGQPPKVPVGPQGQSTESTEQLLAKEGFLDLNRKNYVTPLDWQLELSNAMAERTARLTIQKQQQFQQELVQKQSQEQLAAENLRRFNTSFNETIIESGLDFAGNPQLYEEVKNVARAYRDPQNLDMIAPDAFYKATMDVMRQKNMPIPQNMLQRISVPVQQQQQLPPNLGRSTVQPAPVQKQVGDIMREKLVEQYHNRRNVAFGTRKF